MNGVACRTNRDSGSFRSHCAARHQPYLNTQSDDHGRDRFASFIRKELHTRARTFAPTSAARASFVRDVDRIEKYLATELRPSTNGLALFACAGAENFFEAVQLNAPLERHEIYVDRQPHLYPLALVTKQFPRYAAVVADTDSARRHHELPEPGSGGYCNLSNEVFGFYTGSKIYPNQREYYHPTIIFGMRWASGVE